MEDLYANTNAITIRVEGLAEFLRELMSLLNYAVGFGMGILFVVACALILGFMFTRRR